MDSKLFDAPHCSAKHRLFAQGLLRPLHAPAAPARACITNLTSPQCAVLKRPSQPAWLRVTSSWCPGAQDRLLIHPLDTHKAVSAAANMYKRVVNARSRVAHEKRARAMQSSSGAAVDVRVLAVQPGWACALGTLCPGYNRP